MISHDKILPNSTYLNSKVNFNMVKYTGMIVTNVVLGKLETYYHYVT